LFKKNNRLDKGQAVRSKKMSKNKELKKAIFLLENFIIKIDGVKIPFVVQFGDFTISKN